jgi:DNA mismatch repair protein MutL
MENIHILQPTVAARVRSGYVIQTVAQAVEECLCNSIDAGATEVQIVVDERYLNFEVEDNGHGIPADSFKSLGVRFATSKLRNLNQLLAGPSTYGFRGEALASLAECSVLHISSKARGQFQTWTKVISGGATLQLGLSHHQRKIHGTVVSVKDFQYNQPVRRQHSQLSRWGTQEPLFILSWY